MSPARLPSSAWPTGEAIQLTTMPQGDDAPEALAHALVGRIFDLLHECRATLPKLEVARLASESASAQAERHLYLALIGAIYFAGSVIARAPFVSPIDFVHISRNNLLPCLFDAGIAHGRPWLPGLIFCSCAWSHSAPIGPSGALARFNTVTASSIVRTSPASRDDLLTVAAPFDVLCWRVGLPPDAAHVLDAQAQRGDLAATARAGPHRPAPAEFIQPDRRDERG
jgi:hypothetical protein